MKMKEYKIIISIDPGANGSITHVKIIEGQMASLPISVKMPKEFREINNYLKSISESLERCICFIEKVNLRPSDMVGGKAFGMQKLMRNFEFCKAALIENNIGFIQVHPLKWQNYLKVKLPKGQKETSTEKKNRFKEVAQNNYPGMKVGLFNSDALLILSFGFKMIKTDRQYMSENLPDVDMDLLF